MPHRLSVEILYTAAIMDIPSPSIFNSATSSNHLNFSRLQQVSHYGNQRSIYHSILIKDQGRSLPTVSYVSMSMEGQEVEEVGMVGLSFWCIQRGVCPYGRIIGRHYDSL